MSLLPFLLVLGLVINTYECWKVYENICRMYIAEYFRGFWISPFSIVSVKYQTFRSQSLHFTDRVPMSINHRLGPKLKLVNRRFGSKNYYSI